MSTTLCTCHPGVRNAHKVIVDGPESIADRRRREDAELNESNASDYTVAAALNGHHLSFAMWCPDLAGDYGWHKILHIAHQRHEVAVHLAPSSKDRLFFALALNPADSVRVARHRELDPNEEAGR